MARRRTINEALAETSFLYGGNAAYHRGSLRPLRRPIPTRSTPSWQAFFGGAAGRRRGRRGQNAARRVLEEAELADRRPMASWSPPSTATGPRSRRPSATRSRPRRRQAGAAISRAEVRAGDARLRARHHADPRLPHARPPPRQPRSARPRATPGDAEELASVAPTASPRPTATGRSSSTTCSGLESATHPRDPRRSCERTYCGDARRRVHAHLRSRARRPGSRSASRAATRRSPSPARASARSSTS